jgi:hypothetical protein
MAPPGRLSVSPARRQCVRRAFWKALVLRTLVAQPDAHADAASGDVAMLACCSLAWRLG